MEKTIFRDMEGEIVTLSQEEKRVIDLLRRKPFQSLTIRVQDGKIVHITVEESIRLEKSNTTGKNEFSATGPRR